MNEQEKQILDMLRHWWYVKRYIPDDLMCWALSELHSGNNPFTGKLGAHLRNDPRAQRGIDFNDPPPVFSYSLKHIAREEKQKEFDEGFEEGYKARQADEKRHQDNLDEGLGRGF